MFPANVINCLAYQSIVSGTSGSLIGAYDFGTGSGTAVIYNNIHPTGNNFSGDNVFGPALPFVSVGINPLSYRFSGINVYRNAVDHSGDFSLFAYIDYSGCSRNTTGTSYILFSTQDSPTGSGTFLIGVNDVNRLFMQSSGYSKTLNYELKDKNLIYIGLGAQRYLDFGVFDLLNNNLASESISLDILQKDINKIYVGGLLSHTQENTGYFGRVNDILYFNEQLTLENIKSCAQCIFSTGQITGSPPVTNAYIMSVTGTFFSGINESVVTGLVSYTGSIQKADGTLLPVVLLSGAAQDQQTEEIATLLTGVSLVQLTGATPQIFLQDTGKINGFTQYSLEFDQILVSGDTLEIHTYPAFNLSVNNQIINLEYPNVSFTQLIGNGLVETKDVDYQVDRGFISGFFEDDILFYDILTGDALVSPFSGYWTGDRIQMSGGSFYPPTSQFLEKSGLIFISGIRGSGFDIKYDVYMDGQKLNSGVNYYYSGVSGTNYAVLDPNYVPRLIVYPDVSPINGLNTGILDVEDAEITFLPSYGAYTRYFYNITGDTSVFTSITGFSERVWVNGVRQRKIVDYLRNFSCTLNSGVNELGNLPFVFYNNDSGLWNIN